jgi:hypothetical protein
MRIIILSAILLIISVCGYTQTVDENRVEGELLVMLKGDLDPLKDPALSMALSQNQITPVRKVTVTLNVWLFRYNEETTSPVNALNAVKDMAGVALAQYNHHVTERETIPNDESFDLQWALKNTGQSGGVVGADIKATEAWDISTSGLTVLGDTIVIAVVDGGADLNHADLNFKKNWKEIQGNQIDDDNNGYIDDFHGWNAYTGSGNVVSHDHGTHVAGIAAAKTNNTTGVAGVSFNSKVLPVAGSSSFESVVVAAYDYVYTMRKMYNDTDGEYGAFIVASNSSFGVDAGDPEDYPLWGALYDSMGSVGIANVASTANRNWDVDVVGDIPTAMTNESIIAVTNTTNTDERNTMAAFGAQSVDLGAPGSNIYSTRSGNTYGYKTGTSMASPMVSGSIALMYSVTDSIRMLLYKENPELAVSVMKSYLLATVDSIPALEGITVSGGRLNLLNAVLMAANPPAFWTVPNSISLTIKPEIADTITIEVFSSSTEPDNFTITYSPDQQWLSGDTAGSCQHDQPQLISLIFNTAGMAEGEYQTTLIMDDFFRNNLEIPVSLKVDADIATNYITVEPTIKISPNPFEESLRININLPYSSEVNVRVLNMQGSTIATLKNGYMVKGSHTLIWEGKNSNNLDVSPGVYLIVINDEYGIQTLKTIKK